MKIDDLRTGKAVTRRYRNRRIGEFLKELDLTEVLSTRIPKILHVMRENGSPTPIFETDDETSYFLICLPIHAGALKDNQKSTHKLSSTDPFRSLVNQLQTGEKSSSFVNDFVGLS